MRKRKTLFQKCLETDAHSRFVARAEGLGRDLTEDEALNEIQYLIISLRRCHMQDWMRVNPWYPS